MEDMEHGHSVNAKNSHSSDDTDQSFEKKSLVEELNDLSSNTGRFKSRLGDRHQYAGVDIAFEGITVEVGRGKKSKTILSDISGHMRSGSLTALMGPSGSGKTTLVDVITKRKNTGRRRGIVLYNGEKPKESFLKYHVAYVQQDDALIVNMTVKETLLYNYDLVMGKFTGKRDRNEAVERVLEDLALSGCRDTMVGSSFQRGISGGQRKRVAIGISLLGNPSVLFMDEPTSGLDSFTAYEIISLIKSLASRGLTTISTIHAPNSSIFALFDTLMILLDGKTVYLGDARAAIEFFKSFGFDGPRDSSPADWLTAIVVQTSRLHRSEELARYYEKSHLHSDTVAYLKTKQEDGAVEGLGSMMHMHSPSWFKRTGLFSTFCIIRHRMKANYRMANFVIPRVFEKAIFAIFILTLYWGVGKELPEDADYQTELARPMSITTALFMWGILPAFGSVSVIPSIYHERNLFDREKRSGYYNSGSYLFAKVFEEGLIAFLTSAALACAVWFALSLTGSWALFWLVYFVTTLVGIVMAYGFAAVAPNTEYAIIMCAGINIILLFFVGLLIRWQDIPAYWKWLVYINHLHYSWAALMTNQFTVEDVIAPFNIPILEYFNLDSTLSAWGYLGYESIFIVVFFLLGSCALRFINYGKR
jgi:ABC-type multidrug transport system ATPase subunit